MILEPMEVLTPEPPVVGTLGTFISLRTLRLGKGEEATLASTSALCALLIR